MLYLPSKVVLLRLMRACAAGESLNKSVYNNLSSMGLKMFYEVTTGGEEIEDDDSAGSTDGFF